MQNRQRKMSHQRQAIPAKLSVAKLVAVPTTCDRKKHIKSRTSMVADAVSTSGGVGAFNFNLFKSKLLLRACLCGLKSMIRIVSCQYIVKR